MVSPKYNPEVYNSDLSIKNKVTAGIEELKQRLAKLEKDIEKEQNPERKQRLIESKNNITQTLARKEQSGR